MPDDSITTLDCKKLIMMLSVRSDDFSPPQTLKFSLLSPTARDNPRGVGNILDLDSLGMLFKNRASLSDALQNFYKTISVDRKGNVSTTTENVVELIRAMIATNSNQDIPVFFFDSSCNSFFYSENPKESKKSIKILNAIDTHFRNTNVYFGGFKRTKKLHRKRNR